MTSPAKVTSILPMLAHRRMPIMITERQLILLHDVPPRMTGVPEEVLVNVQSAIADLMNQAAGDDLALEDDVREEVEDDVD